jgi:hypothetical protein
VDPCHCPAPSWERLEGSQQRRQASARPARCRHRHRRCLLKGCEQPFWPKHPQARYCSPACQQAARRWRNWRASQQYRASERGRRTRREQSRRQRQRRQTRRASAPVEPASSSESLPTLASSSSSEPASGQAGAESATPAAALAVPSAASADGSEPREGQRPACRCENLALRPCDRPGCYVLFAVPHELSSKHFCSGACRLALRRVLDRETRYQARRRHQRRQRVPRRRRLPDTS